MNKLSSQDRSALIKLASSLPAGSPERKAILASLKEAAGDSWGVYGVKRPKKVKIKVLKDVRDAYGDRPILFRKGEVIDGEADLASGLIKVWPGGIPQIVGINDRGQKGRWEIVG